MEEEDLGYQEERPLDFSQHLFMSKCPYCGETLSSDELVDHIAPESNTFVCPNCRKKLNVDELGGGL